MTNRHSLMYAGAFGGVLLFLAGLLLTVRGIAGGWTGGTVPAGLPAALTGAGIPGLALIVLGLAGFGGAWAMANRAARPLTLAGAAARGSTARKAFLYGGQLILLTVAAVLAILALRGTALRLFAQVGLGPDSPDMGWPIAQAITAILALGLWGYLRHETLRDGDVGREQGAAVGLRRVYSYLTAFAGMALSVGGAGEFIRSVVALGIQPLAPEAAWRVPMAGAGAALVAGLLLTSLAWRWSSRGAAARPGPEMNALSRVLLRYGALFLGALVTLLTLGYLINDTLLLILGQRAGQWWSYALAYFPAALVLWLASSSGIQSDRARGGESVRTARIRRVVRYGITGLALAAFWVGLAQVGRLVLQVALARRAGNVEFNAAWRGGFALATALVLVGAPAWWGHWWPLHARARLNTPAGHNERASTIRRVYLFAVTLLGAAVLVFSLGFGAFLALNLDASTTIAGVLAALAGAGASVVVAAMWVIAHALVLRGDARLLAQDEVAAERLQTQKVTAPPAVKGAVRPVVPPAAGTPAVVAAPGLSPSLSSAAPRSYRREDLPSLADVSPVADVPAVEPPAFAVPLPVVHQGAGCAAAIVDGADGLAGAALITALRRTLPELVIWPVGLNAAAQVEMLAALDEGTPPAVPATALDLAAFILGPADIVTPGGMAGEVTDEIFAAISDSPATVLLLPARDARLHWIAAPDWPLSQWVDHAAREVQQALGALPVQPLADEPINDL